MELKDILKVLSINDISAKMTYDVDMEMFVLDLQTLAKSHLYLYENGLLKGRYNYESYLELNLDTILKDLCYEFTEALHGRDFGNVQWFSLCDKLNIKYK
jgi:hypothetical protein